MTEAAIPPPPPPPPPAAPPERACDECGATLDERQEICVECGHTVGEPARRRLRGALPTASLAAFAILLGASAAYGLSAGGASNVKDLGVGAKKPPAPSTIAQATPTTPPPATTSSTPDTVPQATATPPPASTPAATPKPSKKAKASKPATTTPSTSSAPAASAPGPSSSGGGGNHHTTKKPPRHKTPPPSWLADGDPPYDAFNYNGGSKPKNAIDGSTKTAWTTRSTGNGIVIDTGAAQPYSSVGIATSTPGYAVTIYWSNDKNSTSGTPASDGWRRSGGASSVKKYQLIHIKSNQPRYLLIYVTKLPSGGKASINEVKLVF